ncbi:MAG: serine hydrolase [Myxococcota bacterium]
MRHPLPSVVLLFVSACVSANAESDKTAAPITVQDKPFAEATLDAAGHVTQRLVAGEPAGGVYQAGSISKFACTLVAMRLENAELLKLDDTVAQLLPDYQGQAGRVTLR